MLTLSEPIKRRLLSPHHEINSGQKTRARRSVSTEKNVEMLMVADKTMHEFYKDGLEEYLLTIANMVCYDHVCNKKLDCDWSSARLFRTLIAWSGLSWISNSSCPISTFL